MNREEAKAYLDNLSAEEIAELDVLIGIKEMPEVVALLAIKAAPTDAEDD
jgi:hypothetical protein